MQRRHPQVEKAEGGPLHPQKYHQLDIQRTGSRLYGMWTGVSLKRESSHWYLTDLVDVPGSVRMPKPKCTPAVALEEASATGEALLWLLGRGG